MRHSFQPRALPGSGVFCRIRPHLDGRWCRRRRFLRPRDPGRPSCLRSSATNAMATIAINANTHLRTGSTPSGRTPQYIQRAAFVWGTCRALRARSAGSHRPMSSDVSRASVGTSQDTYTILGASQRSSPSTTSGGTNRCEGDRPRQHRAWRLSLSSRQSSSTGPSRTCSGHLACSALAARSWPLVASPSTAMPLCAPMCERPSANKPTPAYRSTNWSPAANSITRWGQPTDEKAIALKKRSRLAASIAGWHRCRSTSRA